MRKWKYLKSSSRLSNFYSQSCQGSRPNVSQVSTKWSSSEANDPNCKRYTRFFTYIHTYIHGSSVVITACMSLSLSLMMTVVSKPVGGFPESFVYKNCSAEKTLNALILSSEACLAIVYFTTLCSNNSKAQKIRLKSLLACTC